MKHVLKVSDETVSVFGEIELLAEDSICLWLRCYAQSSQELLGSMSKILYTKSWLTASFCVLE